VDTKAVLDHHLTSFGAADVDEALADYTDESVMITPEGVVKGRDEIRGVLEGFFSGLFAPGTYSFAMDTLHVVDDVAYIVWHASCADADITLGTDTFVVRDGKIAVQTYTPKIEPK